MTATSSPRQGRGAFGKVYKALRGGVQDVAVKQLHHTGDGQLEHFIEVSERYQQSVGCHSIQLDTRPDLAWRCMAQR
jgi:hypothetical protein